ncbi:hypothetical protein ACGFJ7_28090 [Actinoplanes sp. NPDC048988]
MTGATRHLVDRASLAALLPELGRGRLRAALDVTEPVCMANQYAYPSLL